MTVTSINHRVSKVPPHDGRSAEGRFMRRVREELMQHVGRNPSVTQKALVERIAWLSFHVASFDQKALDQGSLSFHDSRSYLAFSNSLTRALRQLGLKAAPVPQRSLQEHLAARSASA